MKTTAILVLLTCALLAGCGDARSARRFYLPLGDAAQGKAAFVALDCARCHSVQGVSDLPAPTVPLESRVVLGGDEIRVRSYGDLLTAIVHPNYQLSERMLRTSTMPPRPDSPMPVVNDAMTVTQLIDLVTFLQPKYTQLRPLYDYNEMKLVD